MNKLIARLEESVGPDRELDEAIYKLVRSWQSPLETRRLTPDNEYCPLYTYSIEAALTLVPEGWTWMVSNRAPKPSSGRAYLNNRQTHFVGIGAAPNPDFRSAERTAATPAIALCLTALEARLALTSPLRPEGQ